MKTPLLITLIASALLPAAAQAGTGGLDLSRFRVSAGDVSVTVTSASATHRVDDHRDHRRDDRRDRRDDRRDRFGSCPPPVFVQPCPPPRPPVYCPPAGYWTVREARVWVPGRWVVRHDACDRPVRYFETGHFETRQERVWVSLDGRSRHHG